MRRLKLHSTSDSEVFLSFTVVQQSRETGRLADCRLHAGTAPLGGHEQLAALLAYSF